MATPERFAKDLIRPTPGPWHDELLDWCKEKVANSRQFMSEKYDDWDNAHEAFKASVKRNKEDSAAEKRDEPKRQAIPLAFAQIETFVSFLMTLFLQRERVFELVPTGEEDHDPAKLGEAALAHDLRNNIFEIQLYKFLLSIAKYNLGVFKLTWEEEFSEEEVVPEQEPVMIAGVDIGGGVEAVRQRVKVRAGNKIEVISPYCFFPDPNYPIHDFQKGEFVASEMLVTKQRLREWELAGEVFGIEHITGMPKETATSNRRVLRPGKEFHDMMRVPEREMTGSVILTEVQMSIVPKRFKLEEEELGEQDYPVLYKVWIANDARIVSVEPLDYPHGKFCYAVGEFTADSEELISQSLADNVRPLQDTSSWLVSSHIANVRKVINNQLVADGSVVNVQDIIERNPVIRLLKSAAGMDAARAVKQLEVRDVTSAHMTDAKQMYDLAQIVTGISDNAMGQYSPGRRSALEARNVNAGAAMRLKMHAMLIFRGALEPLARMMLKNLQAWLDVETFVRVMGYLADPGMFVEFKAITGQSLAGNYDFELFDGTLPSERGAQAAALQEFLQFVGGNPEVLLILGYDPKKIMHEWLLLRGIKNPDRFKMDEVRQQELQMQIEAQNARENAGRAGGPNGPAGGESGSTGNTPIPLMAGAGGSSPR